MDTLQSTARAFEAKYPRSLYIYRVCGQRGVLAFRKWAAMGAKKNVGAPHGHGARHLEPSLSFTKDGNRRIAALPSIAVGTPFPLEL